MEMVGRRGYCERCANVTCQPHNLRSLVTHATSIHDEMPRSRQERQDANGKRMKITKRHLAVGDKRHRKCCSPLEAVSTIIVFSYAATSIWNKPPLDILWSGCSVNIDRKLTQCRHDNGCHATRQSRATLSQRRNCCVCPFVRPSVCLSVTSRYCIETTSRIELVFGMEASFYLSHTVLCGNSGIFKTRIGLLPSGTLSQTLELKYFTSARRSRQRVVTLVRQRWTISVIN